MTTHPTTNLLPGITHIDSYGTPHPDEQRRDTVVAVVLDGDTGLYLCQYWQGYDGLTCLLSGGVEAGESNEEAIVREIEEETGFTDYTVVGKLGAEIRSHYQKKNGQYFVKHITAYAVRLNNKKQKNTQLEDDEKFENFFKSGDTILRMMTQYEKVSGSVLMDHKEILRRGIAYFGN